VSGGKFFRTFVRILGAVKGSTQGKSTPFEGIGMVLVALVLVIASAVLAIPRAAEPTLLPLPQPDRRVLERARRADDALAQKARTEPLSYVVRAVGETFRRLGAGTVHGEGVPTGLLRDLEKLVEEARAQKRHDELRALRAVQTALFIEAVRAWEKTGRPSAELRELGGDFAEVAKERGWLSAGHLELDDEELGILFRRRWTELTGTGDKPPLAPSLDELRAWYALLLGRASAGQTVEGRRTSLLAIAALERLDATYPADLARGVLFYRHGAYGAASEAFRRELERRKQGPYQLRARNHLLAALAKLPEEE